MRVRHLTCAAVVVLVAAACGSDDATTVAGPIPESAAEATLPDASDSVGDSDATAAPAGPGDVPAFDMTDVHTGQTVDLRAVVDGSAPLLLWFWAPH